MEGQIGLWMDSYDKFSSYFQVMIRFKLLSFNLVING